MMAMRYYELVVRKGIAPNSIESYRSDNGNHIETVLDDIKPKILGKKVAIILNDAYTEGCRCAYDKFYPEIEELRKLKIKYESAFEAYKMQHEADKDQKARLRKRVEELELRLEHYRESA